MMFVEVYHDLLWMLEGEANVTSSGKPIPSKK